MLSYREDDQKFIFHSAPLRLMEGVVFKSTISVSRSPTAATLSPTPFVCPSTCKECTAYGEQMCKTCHGTAVLDENKACVCPSSHYGSPANVKNNNCILCPEGMQQECGIRIAYIRLFGDASYIAKPAGKYTNSTISTVDQCQSCPAAPNCPANMVRKHHTSSGKRVAFTH